MTCTSLVPEYLEQQCPDIIAEAVGGKGLRVKGDLVLHPGAQSLVHNLRQQDKFHAMCESTAEKHFLSSPCQSGEEH